MSVHPGYSLSRSCIQDTLQAKRSGAYLSSGLAASLYGTTIRMLRGSQLAPYRDSLKPLRYLHLAQLKNAAPEIIVVLRNGQVESVLSSNPYTKVWLADYGHPDDMLDEAEERAAGQHMHKIYPKEA